MELNLQHLDTGTLEKLYNSEVEALHSRLLGGASWSETEDQRKYVTQLSIALNNRYAIPLGHPAETQLRYSEPDESTPVNPS